VDLSDWRAQLVEPADFLLNHSCLLIRLFDSGGAAHHAYDLSMPSGSKGILAQTN
jgi:hypothetical protein